MLSKAELEKKAGISKSVIEDTFKYGFRHKYDIKIFLEHGLQEPVLSDKTICGKNHTSPFEFFSDVILGKVKDYIVWANRGGSKSYIAGLIAWITSGLYPKTEINILGGSYEQSEKSYNAMNGFWDISGMRGLLKKEPLQSDTLWANGSQVHILTASQKSARGGHPQKLILDEVDEMDKDILEAALQQPQSKYGINSGIGIYSTNHHRGGTMDFVLDMAQNQGGFKIYKWCIWECLESCQDYSCSTCPLSSICPGKQMKQADGYYKISDFVQKLKQNSMETIRTEWFCEKVGSRDLIYGADFGPDKHIVSIDFNPNYDVYLSIDWGGVHPFSIGLWQNFPELGWVRVGEIYEGNTTNQRILKYCKEQDWWNNVQGGVADPARNDLIAEWKDEGIDLEPADNAVDDGIEAVKNALNPAIGKPTIHISNNCKAIIKEFGSYRQKNGKPVKENDHALDELRYFVMWKIVEKKKAGFHVSVL